MTRQRLILATLFAFSLLSTQTYAAPKACDIDRPIVFGGLDWESAQFHNAVARYILEKGYQCKTDELPGSSMPILTGLIRGDIDVMLEVWTASIPEAWEKALKKGKVTQLGPNFENAIQGWYVPRYLVEGDKKRGIKALAPDLKTARDLKKYKHLFKDPENPNKGLFLNCILGWFCEPVNSKKLIAYGLDKDFTNLKPGTGAALNASIASNYKRGRPFVTYYWSPTWVMGTYDMILLEEPVFEQAKWDAFIAGDVSKATAFPTVTVYKGLHTKFAKKAPVVAEFISKYQTSTEITNKALAYLKSKRGIKSRDAAIHFLKGNNVWQQWVPKDMIATISSALKAEKTNH